MISGTAGGLRLLPVPGRDTRPTLDRVRESLFAILSPRLDGARVLDLYAGTGALGIEALSRGAERCTFVEWEPRAIRILRQNLEQTHLSEQASVLRLHLPKGLGGTREHAPFDLALADPPYAFRDWASLLTELLPLLGPDAVIVCEHGRGVEPQAPAGVRRIRRETYGQTQVSIFGKGGG